MSGKVIDGSAAVLARQTTNESGKSNAVQVAGENRPDIRHAKDLSLSRSPQFEHEDRAPNVRRRNLTRSHLAHAVAERCVGLSAYGAYSLVQCLLEEVVSALVRGDPVRFRNFGSFHVRKKSARPGRNPRTGVIALVSARKVVIFRPSPTLKAKMNRKGTLGESTNYPQRRDNLETRMYLRGAEVSPHV